MEGSQLDLFGFDEIDADECPADHESPVVDRIVCPACGAHLLSLLPDYNDPFECDQCGAKTGEG